MNIRTPILRFSIDIRDTADSLGRTIRELLEQIAPNFQSMIMNATGKAQGCYVYLTHQNGTSWVVEIEPSLSATMNHVFVNILDTRNGSNERYEECIKCDPELSMFTKFKEYEVEEELV